MKEFVGKAYPALKEKYGVTQKQLAKIIDVHHITIAKLLGEYRQENKSGLTKVAGLTSYEELPELDVSSIVTPNDTTNLTDSGDGGQDDNEGGENQNGFNLKPNEPIRFQSETNNEKKFQFETKESEEKNNSLPEGRRTDLNNGVTVFRYEKK